MTFDSFLVVKSKIEKKLKLKKEKCLEISLKMYKCQISWKPVNTFPQKP